MNFESLWLSPKENMIYCFGGERLLTTVTLAESIWASSLIAGEAVSGLND